MNHSMLVGYQTPLQRQERDDAMRRQQAERVIRSIARAHGTTYGAVMSRLKGNVVVCNARHHAMAVVRWSTGWSYPQIARVFNRFDHTTVIAAERKWAGILADEHGLLEDRPALEDVIHEAQPPASFVEAEAYPRHEDVAHEALPMPEARAS
jgi:chromosomal replication initiator protein